MKLVSYLLSSSATRQQSVLALLRPRPQFQVVASLTTQSTTTKKKGVNNTNNKAAAQQHQQDETFKSSNEKIKQSISPQSVLSQAIEKEKTMINPLEHADFFGVDKLVKLEELFNARVHFGHDAGLRCPWQSDIVFGTRINTDIIDLEKTIPRLRRALNFVAHIAFRHGIILFMTRYGQHIPMVEKTAADAGEYSNCKLWNNGAFTDSTRRFGSVIRLPDVCIFMHTHEKLNEPHGALAEASKMLIPTVAICDTDIDPSLVTFPVPGNDDSVASQKLYCSLFKRAIELGKKKRAELEKRDDVFIELEPPTKPTETKEKAVAF